MNKLEVFKNQEFGEVRTITIDNEPYFVRKDVADILGYSRPDHAISGLYSLILSSKLPNARRFKHWVTSEVLPTIRKHGMYAINELIDNPDLGIAALE